MTIGCLGEVYFTVSSEMVMTLTDIGMDKSISYGSHKVHGGKTLLEYTGSDPDDISFEIELSAFMGVNPSEMIEQLDDMAESGSAVSFVLGTKVYGSGLWVITDISKSFDHIYKDGELMSAKLKLKLKEYAE